ncbi:MAG TPA: tRNA pseudouridine(38-40) synthase TruA [Anaerolineales bacterium]
MARYQVVLAYDGTQFFGFQRQVNERTVQAVVEAALEELGWAGGAILAAGRTDTGVHASGQVIAFDLDWAHAPGELLRAMNAQLPADVAVRAVSPVRDDFHPRFSAAGRRYRYRLFCDEVRHPLRERYAWRVWPAVRLADLQQAAADLPGTHDYAAFGSPPRPGGSTVRTVTRAVWSQDGPDLVFEVEANAFLYHMIRRMVLLQVEFAQDRLEGRRVAGYLTGQAGASVQGLAPPNGLTLVEVIYPPELAGVRNNLKLEEIENDEPG